MSNENQFEQWCKTVMSDDADFCMEYGAYQNLNVRIRWEAWQAAAKSMQSAELQQKLTESERYGRQADITIENLERKVEQLAAENSFIKAMNDCLSEELRGYESDGAFDGPKMHLLWWKVETPSTDEILAEVRASGADECVRQLVISDADDDFCDAPYVCAMVAHQFRQEAK